MLGSDLAREARRTERGENDDDHDDDDESERMREKTYYSCTY